MSLSPHTHLELVHSVGDSVTSAAATSELSHAYGALEQMHLPYAPCAASQRVDACGVCGGDGVAVDVVGTCCLSPLPPSGVCCPTGTAPDSCGVCGGNNECGAVVTAYLTPASVSTAVTRAMLTHALRVHSSVLVRHAMWRPSGVPNAPV